MNEIIENDEIDENTMIGITSEILSPSLPEAAASSETENSQEANMLISGDHGGQKKKVKGIKLVL